MTNYILIKFYHKDRKMIFKLDMTEQTTAKEVEDFIIKSSPYSDKNMRIVMLLENLKNNSLYTHIETLGHEDKNTNSEQYFLVWRNADHTAIFAGTKFITNEEATAGIVLSNHEV